MNLHSIATDYTNQINPNISATLLKSTGYTTAADGTQTPNYAGSLTGMVQVQGINADDYVHINAMNQMPVLRSVWIVGNWAGVVRDTEAGGDILQFPMFPGGAVMSWNIIVVKEQWPEWTSVIVGLQ